MINNKSQKRVIAATNNYTLAVQYIKYGYDFIGWTGLEFFQNDKTKVLENALDFTIYFLCIVFMITINIM